jgi:hypothetical protein
VVEGIEAKMVMVKAGRRKMDGVEVHVDTDVIAER